MKNKIAGLLEELAVAKANVAYAKAKRIGPRLELLHSRKALYFARCVDAIKVGMSTSPEERTGLLQIGAPGPITLVAVIEGAGHRESECHKRLSHLRIHGEWFRYTEEVDELIRELKSAAAS